MDRGIIAEGKAADIVIFDYEKIRDRATFLDPHQFPIGVPYVVINGIPELITAFKPARFPVKCFGVLDDV